MSGIYIKGMEMPIDMSIQMVIHTDGTVEYRYKHGWETIKNGAVFVPDHGRLIDADALTEKIRERKRPTLSDGADGSKERLRYLDFISALQTIKDAPTIIPDKEGKDG